MPEETSNNFKKVSSKVFCEIGESTHDEVICHDILSYPAIEFFLNNFDIETVLSDNLQSYEYYYVETVVKKGIKYPRVNSIFIHTIPLSCYLDNRDAVKRITLPSRYHIFSKADDDISRIAKYNCYSVLSTSKNVS